MGLSLDSTVPSDLCCYFLKPPTQMQCPSVCFWNVCTPRGDGNLPSQDMARKGYHGFALACLAPLCPGWCSIPVSLFWMKYLQLRNISVGNHAYENKGTKQSAMAICQHFYKRGTICPGNDTFDIDPEIETGDDLL